MTRRIDCTSERTILNNKAFTKPSTLNPGTKEDTRRIRMVLIIMRNKPNVMMVIGNVKIMRMGLMIVFTKDITTDAITAVKKESTLTPGRI